MDNSILNNYIDITQDNPQALSPCNSIGRTRSSNSSNSSSPEFEFWRVRDPTRDIPPPPENLLSADELFLDGVLLPLHLLHLKQHHPHDPNPHPEHDPNPPPNPEPGPGPELTSGSTPATPSKRWRDLFKTLQKKGQEDERETKKEKGKKKRASGRGGGPELNINIWPFRRTRSSGDGEARPGPGPVSRKVSSAPCSRSNSSGEGGEASSARQWPSSPGRTGVHLGRNSPIWQVRKGGSGVKSSEPKARPSESGVKKETIRFYKNGNSNVGRSGNSKTKTSGRKSRAGCGSDVSGNSNGGSGNSDFDGANIGTGASLFGFRNIFQ